MAAERLDRSPWYHTIELPDGRVTPGRWDTRHVASRLPWPELTGKRCLDVGTWDGFWAFEMERRGGLVTAIDVWDPLRWDWPRHADTRTWAEKMRYDGFAVAREALGSNVDRVECSVYDVEKLGRFDFVFIGTILIHLRDPVGALMAVRDVTAEVISCDHVSASLSALPYPAANIAGRGEPHWWTPNVRCHKRWLTSAGFTILGSGLYRQQRGPGRGRFTGTLGRLRRAGLPHQWIYAR